MTTATRSSVLRHQKMDDLGRIIPAITLESVLTAIADGWATDRHVHEWLAIASQHGEEDSHGEIVRAARGAGITHYPADLAGRRCPIY